MGDCVGALMGLWAKEREKKKKGLLSRGRGRGGLSGAASLQALLVGKGNPGGKEGQAAPGYFLG